jgi:hypothetical protein
MKRKPVIIRRDDSPVADLRRPWANRLRVDRQVCGAIELAFLRGEHSGYLAGYQDAKRGRKSILHDYQSNGDK